MIDFIILILVVVLFVWLIKTALHGFLIFLAILSVAWFIWFITGGVDRFEESNQGIFIRPTQNYEGFETYGSFPTIPKGTSN